ncbi:hypothetical protein HK097_011295 [Rhizophlyctis rosea]|uniref:Uncharacterized protein n=1 Tax=Rhizophlyctis rosea TaxID=64517 RepID=A0AAD5SEK2_9FUNG|nr:hypothetical protein HK097_011295 [Rhizophlyctis rosea]
MKIFNTALLVSLSSLASAAPAFTGTKVSHPFHNSNPTNNLQKTVRKIIILLTDRTNTFQTGGPPSTYTLHNTTNSLNSAPSFTREQFVLNIIYKIANIENSLSPKFDIIADTRAVKLATPPTVEPYLNIRDGAIQAAVQGVDGSFTGSYGVMLQVVNGDITGETDYVWLCVPEGAGGQ